MKRHVNKWKGHGFSLAWLWLRKCCLIYVDFSPSFDQLALRPSFKTELQFTSILCTLLILSGIIIFYSDLSSTSRMSSLRAMVHLRLTNSPAPSIVHRLLEMFGRCSLNGWECNKVVTGTGWVRFQSKHHHLQSCGFKQVIFPATFICKMKIFMVIPPWDGIIHIAVSAVPDI